MSRLKPPALISAIVYDDGLRITPVIDRIASSLSAEGLRLAGLIQRDVARPGRSRCDMLLEDLATGEIVAISQDRGEGARGCRLDVEALMSAVARTSGALTRGPDLLIVNKFGKTECEGGGCRGLIVEAVERELPVLVAVPVGNLESWRLFAGEFAAEYRFDDLPAEAADLCRCLGLWRARSAGNEAPSTPRTRTSDVLHEQAHEMR